MKSVPAALQAHLDAGATTLCTCWRVQRLDGQVFGFTDHDRPLTFDCVTYQPDSGFSASWRPHLPAKHVRVLVAPNRIVHAYDAAGKVAEGNLASAWRACIAAVFAFPPLGEQKFVL